MVSFVRYADGLNQERLPMSGKQKLNLPVIFGNELKKQVAEASGSSLDVQNNELSVPVVVDLGLSVENIVGRLKMDGDFAKKLAATMAKGLEFKLHAAIDISDSGDPKLKSVSFVHTPDNWDEGGGYR